MNKTKFLELMWCEFLEFLLDIFLLLTSYGVLLDLLHRVITLRFCNLSNLRAPNYYARPYSRARV